MDTALDSRLPHEHISHVSAPSGPAPQSLAVAATFTLSEAGRKASLLAGGDGRGQQRLIVQVPMARLHLVSVDAQGTARLKLQPRFELTQDQEVVRHDGAPNYDRPPTVEELFRDAARNYELERAWRTEQTTRRHRRRDEDRERRLQVATDFLADPSQRAMVRPIPTQQRCFLATANGRLMFDVATDSGVAGDVPREAYRRFRADLQARKEQNLRLRAEQQALHERKKAAMAEWVAGKGSHDQRARHAAGLLPMDAVVDALTDEAFDALAHLPRYAFDGRARLEEALRHQTGRPDLVVAPADLQVVGTNATAATAGQWEVIHAIREALPDAEVTLRAHRLSWRREPALPALTVHGALVTRPIGPFTLRREFAVPER